MIIVGARRVSFTRAVAILSRTALDEDSWWREPAAPAPRCVRGAHPDTARTAGVTRFTPAADCADRIVATSS
jgi:hypothetical protein